MGYFTAMLAHQFQNQNLKRHNIDFTFCKPPKGLQSSPYTISFGDYLKQMSHGEVDIECYNSYTVGDYSNPEGLKRSMCYSNFLEPRSRFKDCWFGCYFILDDPGHKGRRFVMIDPDADPAQPGNVNPTSLRRLPELDQKLISWSTHEKQAGYSFEKFEQDFYFRLKPGTHMHLEQVQDEERRDWTRVTATYETLAALTDVTKTNMAMIESLRIYVGLPNKDVYRYVEPWHKVDLRGRAWVRYFKSPRKRGFWAVPYGNGSLFTRKDGVQVDTWHGRLRDEIDAMFESLQIDVID